MSSYREQEDRRDDRGGGWRHPNGRGQRSRPFRGNSGRPYNRRAPIDDPEFNLKVLEQMLAKKNSLQSLLDLINLKEEVLEFISSDMNDDGIVLLVQLFSTISQLHYKNNIIEIFTIYANDNFVSKLEDFIIRAPLQSVKSGYFWDDVNDFFQKLGILCVAWLDVIPKRALNFLPVICKAALYTIQNVEREHSLEISADVKKTYEDLQVKIVNALDLGAKPKANRWENVDVELTSDFRDISIYPQSEELLANESFGVRKNKIEGGYKSVEQYLDIQFRLLREDFVAPLRQGIAEYLSMNEGKSQESNIKVYSNAKFLRKQMVRSEVGFVVQAFKRGHLKNVETTKRFMFGSLVGFTEDNFKTIKFGKVLDRDTKYLKEGQVVIHFSNPDTLELGKNYTMIECLVFFEPYYHVLKALKQISRLNFPLRQYLIEVNYRNNVPQYIEESAPLEFTVFNTKPCDLIDEDEDIFLMLQNPDEIIEEITYKLPINYYNRWPGSKSLGLNPAQYEAFRAALSQQFTIIQGPPGTGKTFIGLKIAQVLLENISNWGCMGPMLVICYTNHALDQFLEGILPITKDLVRIGGQSKSEIVQPYNLSNHRQYYGKKNYLLILMSSYKLRIGINNNILRRVMMYDSIMDLFNGAGFGLIDDLFNDSWFNDASKLEIEDWLLEGASSGYLHEEENLKGDGKKDNTIDEIDEIKKQTFLYYNYLVDEDVEYKKAPVILNLYAFPGLILRNNRELDNIMEVNPSRYDEVLKYGEILKYRYEYLQHKLNEMKTEIGNSSKPQNVDYDDPFNMSFEDRWKLYKHWLYLYTNRIYNSLLQDEEEYCNMSKRYDEIRDIQDAQYMKTKAVIGMTTTGAARLQRMLQYLDCPIVIVEEAAEVLEAHIVTALSTNCQKLILIGDHKQLRPSTADYQIDKKYNLGISLFERMILNGFNCNTLNIQHRMRAEIAKLVSPAIYPTLENHESVETFEPVKGVQKSLYFITHNNLEKESFDSSKQNSYEATYLMGLANYLVQNGYEAKQITILSAYSGQYFIMLQEQKLYPWLQDIKNTILDNYQGEENDIILLSLVRNNPEGNIGFLKLENRVCVALSRAKLGLYIMGNMNQLCKSEIWRKIKNTLEKEESLGPSLPLQCQNHPDTITGIVSSDDFNSVPEGGCMIPCNQIKECGHICTRMCHALPHSSFICREPCLQVLCEFNHVCTNMCYQTCGNCVVPKTCEHSCGHVHNIPCYKNPDDCHDCEETKTCDLRCGHVHDIPCYMEPAEYMCMTLVQVKLRCDHEVEKLCHLNINDVTCTYPCGATLSLCGHKCPKTCHIMDDPNHYYKYTCNLPCEKQNQKCSQPDNRAHKCTKKCSEQCSPCSIEVTKKLSQCSHWIKVECSNYANQQNCSKICRRRLPCGHMCKERCQDKCGNCQIKVSKLIEECGHTVTLHCSTEPTKLHCTLKCTRMLLCGHNCTLKCGQDCSLSNCKELVNVPNEKSACGHGFLVPCHLKDDPTASLQYCTEPCTATLACQDQCTGSCAKCCQGRFHLPCKKKCHIGLLCGHKCDTPCRFMYKSCSEPCDYKCEHSNCNHACGDPCVECKEKCARVCEHAACMNRCFEECSVEPCTEPCKKSLKCGHECIGYCGDKCPPLCRTCDKEVVMEIEADEAARFVYLEECGHIIQNSAVDTLLAVTSNKISFLCCPKCKTTINHTQRYRKYIKEFLKDLQTVKVNYSEDKIHHEDLVLKFRAISRKYRSDQVSVWRWFDQVRDCPNNYNLIIYNTKCQILTEINEICRSNVGKARVEKNAKLMLKRLMNFSAMSEQTLTDFRLEMKRLERIVQYCQIKEANANCSDLDEYQTCKELVSSVCRYSEEQDQILKDALGAFNKKLETGLTITDTAWKEFEIPISMSSEFWYKCSAGHVYSKTSQDEVCPKCFEAPTTEIP